jgi:hypothetical protein
VRETRQAILRQLASDLDVYAERQRRDCGRQLCPQCFTIVEVYTRLAAEFRTIAIRAETTSPTGGPA